MGGSGLGFMACSVGFESLTFKTWGDNGVSVDFRIRGKGLGLGE